MYVLFALLVALLVYVLASMSLRGTGRDGRALLVFRAVSLVAFIALLVVFSLVSRAIGVDVGPFQTVSYSIPDDFTVRGPVGLATLVVYALACLAPVIGLGAATLPTRIGG